MDIELVAAAALNLCATYTKYLKVYRRYQRSSVKIVKKRIQRRRFWMQAIHQERTSISLNNCLDELLMQSTASYFIHMSSSDFEYLVQRISPIIKKQDTSWRESIPPKIRLAVTLRFLAVGESYNTLHKLFKISSSLVSKIIPEVCQAINVVLKDMIRIPSIPEEWLAKTKGFPFPHCVGALDGKHITIWPPSHTVPGHLNCHGNFSMVLLAIIDCDYSFIYAEVVQSQNTDAEVFLQSDLWEKINTNNLFLPPETPLSGEENVLPFVFLSDGAFPLNKHIMKPFLGEHPAGTPEDIFNQLVSQSHAAVDNAFGILSTTFKVLLKPITLEPAKCSTVIRTCLLLHNFLINSETSSDIYTRPATVDSNHAGDLACQDHFLPIQPLSCTPQTDGNKVRLNFLDYIYRNSLESS